MESSNQSLRKTIEDKLAHITKQFNSQLETQLNQITQNSASLSDQTNKDLDDVRQSTQLAIQDVYQSV